MSNELALTNPNDSDFDAYTRATGLAKGGNSVTLPKLMICRDGADIEGKPFPVGELMVAVDGVTYYAKMLNFRTFLNCYQYSVYDSPNKKFLNRSVIGTDNFAEFPDELGGNKCGRLTKKQRENASPEALKVHEKAVCTRIVFGTIDGVMHERDEYKQNAEGDWEKVSAGKKREFVAQPVRLQLRKGAFMTIEEEALDALLKARKRAIDHFIQTSVKRYVIADTGKVGYQAQFKPDLAKSIAWEKPRDDETWENFAALVKFENAGVMAKHNDALRKGVQSFDGDDARVASAILDGDFEHE